MSYSKSFPLQLWLGPRRHSIEALAQAHAQFGNVGGPGRPLEIGRPVAHAYVLRVVAEFQAFVRDLHDLGDALQAHKERQAEERPAAGGEFSDHDLVFSTRTGGALDAANVRREFKAACKAAKLGEHWTPRELRHSFVSLMSSSGVPLEEIARLAGHSNTRTTEVVYRRELRPVLTTGAEAMDRLLQAHRSPPADGRPQRKNPGGRPSSAA